MSRPRAVRQRFRAAIRKSGVNPCVDVPGRVSRAFSAYARSGRIVVEGRLNRTPIRGTLVPVAGGGHRLYVNGGMRSAAGVEVGDGVSLELQATTVERLGLPADVAAGLESVAGARTAFVTLPPARRRELLRFIDDARTPAARRRRIAQTADHALGRSAAAEPRRAADRPLWTCPKCGNAFVTRNMFHSCERHDVSESFAGKPPFVRALFDRFRKMLEAFGPVRMVPYRDRVGFMVEVRFAGATPRKGWLDVAFWLTRRIDSPRFRKVETLYPNVHVYRVRVTRPEDFDVELEGWLREAYAVGCRRAAR